MALIIAGERSGVGKTTVTLSMLAALCRWGQPQAVGEAIAPTSVQACSVQACSVQACSVQSFKIGPDYIDPMFHTRVTGRPCRNLDAVLTSPDYVRQCFATHSQNADAVLIEGVMGVFDGLGRGAFGACHGEGGCVRAEGCGAPSGYCEWREAGDFGSPAYVARLLDVPVALVIDAGRMAASVAAIALGYRSLNPHLRFAGVILNRVASDRHETLLRKALEPWEVPVLGVVRRREAIALPDRHLGLVPTAELPELERVLDELARLGEMSFDWQALWPLLRQESVETSPQDPLLGSATVYTQVAPSSPNPLSLGRRGAGITVFPVPPLLGERGLGGEDQCRARVDDLCVHGSLGSERGDQTQRAEQREYADAPGTVQVAIAQDEAFSFYYADNLDILQALGVELVPWSPLRESLPVGVQGLYLGGGFPEVFAAQLAANEGARAAVQAAIAAGMPTYAECGGLMYLCQFLTDFEGRSWPMVGVIPQGVRMGKRLHLGYRRAVAQRDAGAVTAGQVIWGHEFHRSQVEALGRSHRGEAAIAPETNLYYLTGTDQPNPVPEGFGLPQVHASYVHVHWGVQPWMAERFVAQCRAWTLGEARARGVGPRLEGV